MSANDTSVRLRSFKSRIVVRIAFSAVALTAGVNPQNSSLLLEFFTQRGRAVSEEVKFDVRILFFATPVLAVNDLGFRRVQFQATDCEASLKIGLEGLRFWLGPAVNQPVIRIPTPRKVWVRPRHPEVEHVVQKKI